MDSQPLAEVTEFMTCLPAFSCPSQLDPDGSSSILIVGIPRSGTTWTGKVLGHTGDVEYVHEPDSEHQSGFAVRAKEPLGRFPVLAPGDTAVLYESLWRHALDGTRFAGGRLARGRYELQSSVSTALHSGGALNTWLGNRTSRQGIRLRLGGYFAPPVRSWSRPGRLVVKSVHAVLALEWLYEKFRPNVVVVLRNPLDVIASMKELGWLGGRGVVGWPEVDLVGERRTLAEHPLVQERYLKRWGLAAPRQGWSRIQRAAYHVGLLACALQESVESHPEWSLVTHEWLCGNPPLAFRVLVDRLGLRWTGETTRFIEKRNRPGTGFQTRRSAAGVPNSWRQRLSASEAQEVFGILELFPLDPPPNWDWRGKASAV